MVQKLNVNLPGLFRADIIKLKCRVALPTVDVSAIEADKELHARIKDFLMLHEDEAIYRRIPVCSECIGLQM